MIEKKKLLISFSGGRTSAFMTKWLLENKKDEYDMIVVFANTGKENQATLDFVDQCDKAFGFNVVWVEAVTNPIHKKGVTAKVVNFDSASRNGEPFEAMIAKHGIPNVKQPHCTRELKKYAIRNYAKQIGWKKYETAIGIRTDEMDRMSDAKKKEGLIYPLISMHPTSKFDINSFWMAQPFDLKLKGYEGNCNCCWKKSLRKLLTLAKENPQSFDWWLEMERKYENFAPPTKGKMLKKIADGQPMRFNRREMSYAEIIELSKQPFNPATDDSQITSEQKKGEKINGIDLDMSNGCVESCEVF